jgi:hypothetical protein
VADAVRGQAPDVRRLSEPRPLTENGSPVVSVAINTIAGRAATGSEIRSEWARSAFTATNKNAETTPTTAPHRTACGSRPAVAKACPKTRNLAATAEEGSSPFDRRGASHSTSAEPARIPTPMMEAATSTRSSGPAASRHAHPANPSRARPASPARRSRTTLARGGATPAARSRKRNDLYASPPKPVGRNALKNVPTKVRRTRSQGGNASPRGRRNSCQRNAFTISPASSTRNASAISLALACRSESVSARASARASRRTTMSTPTAARKPIRIARPLDRDRLGDEDGKEFSMTEAYRDGMADPEAWGPTESLGRGTELVWRSWGTRSASVGSSPTAIASSALPSFS